MNGSIQHAGTVVRTENDTVYVRIVQQSACAGCHAKAMCNASESKEKIIEVEDHTGQYQIGEHVAITGQSSLGLQAVFLAFIVPLFIILAALVAGDSLQWEETANGLASLLLLVPYYSVLYRMRGKLKKRFVFKIKKI